ncbi:peptidylprolyl isomerase [Helicobacter sp.]|uniref:peptidylprolyl isomerase n=1 Tax=Helicobacter sp. TaxID=218 RepID=UPI0037508319|nr:peptidyl-prolyl cis-trans isomerase [Helicobacter sp.]MDD7346245.1 peptidylprolyl isomerase [Helicobacter sp.]
MRYVLIICLWFGGMVVASDVIAGVAVRVNGHAITLHEIEKMQKTMKVDRQQAIDLLINERLKDDEIERFKIGIDEFKIDDEIGRIASSNGINKSALIAQLAREGVSYQAYRADLKKQLQTRELMQKILASNVNITDESELFAYYNAHKKDFEVPSSVKVMRYSTSSDALLQKAMKDPKKNIEGVQKQEETINMHILSPQIAQVFVTTPKGDFTPVLNAGNNVLVSFLVLEKLGEKLMSYEEAKPMVNQRVMAQKEQSIIKEHFAKIRASAKIVYLRE